MKTNYLVFFDLEVKVHQMVIASQETEEVEKHKSDTNALSGK